jgi:hypothetical protein
MVCSNEAQKWPKNCKINHPSCPNLGVDFFSSLLTILLYVWRVEALHIRAGRGWKFSEQQQMSAAFFIYNCSKSTEPAFVTVYGLPESIPSAYGGPVRQMSKFYEHFLQIGYSNGIF